MSGELRLYSGNVSAGGIDGTKTIGLAIGVLPTIFAVRFSPGFSIRSNSVVRVWADGPEGASVQFAPDVLGSPGSWGASLDLAGVGDTNTRCWCQAIGPVSPATLIRVSGSSERSNYIADFSGAAGLVADSAYFYPLVGGTGTVVTDGTIGMVLTSPVTSAGALLWRREAISFTRPWAVGVRFRAVSAGTGGAPAYTGYHPLGVFASAFPIVPAADASVSPSHRLLLLAASSSGLKFSIARRNAANVWRYWNAGTGTWQATATLYSAAYDTDYWGDIEFDPTTGFRVTVRNAGRSVVLLQSGWAPMSDMMAFSGGFGWLYSGEMWTDAHTGRISLSAWEEV